MELVDIAKIVVPIIVALCGALFLMMRWVIDKQAASTQTMWESINASLLNNIKQHAENFESFKRETHQKTNRFERQIHDLESNLSSHKKEVAEWYIKRQDWLEHAVALERKVDELRRDVHKELQDISKQLGQINKRVDD